MIDSNKPAFILAVLITCSLSASAHDYEQLQHASAHGEQASSVTATFERAPTAGNLLLLHFGARHGTDFSLPGDWTIAWDLNQNQRFVVAYKVAAENEPESVTVTVTHARELVLLIEERGPADAIDHIIFNDSAGQAVTTLSTGPAGELGEHSQHAIASFLVQSAVWGGETFSNGFTERSKAGQNSQVRPYIITAEKLLEPLDTVETTLTLPAASRLIGGLLTVIPGPAPEHVPGRLEVVTRRANSAELAWTDSYGGVAPRFAELQISTSGQAWAEVDGAICSPASLTNLADDTEYQFRVRYEDADGSVAYSNSVAVTTSNVPIAIAEDDTGTTDGVIRRMGPCMIGFLMTGSEFGAGDFGNVRPEWNFGDEGSPYNELRGFGVAHFYDVDSDTEVTKTVTLMITNVDQEIDVATRTVVITPNTRRKIYIDPDTGSANPEDPSDPNDPFDTPKNAWEGTTGSNLEFILTAGKTHHWETMFNGLGSRHNIIVRSSEKGVKANVAAQTTVIGGANQMGIRDIHFVAAGGDSARRILDARYRSANPSTQCWAVDCTSADPMVTTGITDHTSYFNLWQNIQTDDSTSVNNMWGAGEGTIILGCCIRHGGNAGVERPMRMKGDHVLVWDTVASARSSKNAFTRNGGRWLWVSGSTFTVENGGASAMSLTHNEGSRNGRVENVVVEQVLLTAPSGTAGDHAILWVGNNDQDANGIVLRNVICSGGRIFVKLGFAPGQLLEDMRMYNVTIIHDTPRASYIAIQDSLHRDLTIQSVLGVSGGMNTRQTIQMLGEVPDLSVQMPLIHGNVMPPVEDGLDITVGNASESWEQWNQRDPFYGAENKSKFVMLDSSYRPLDLNDPDLIGEMPRDMINFQEDFYGNPRTPEAWYVGAVGLPLGEAP